MGPSQRSADARPPADGEPAAEPGAAPPLTAAQVAQMIDAAARQLILQHHIAPGAVREEARIVNLREFRLMMADIEKHIQGPEPFASAARALSHQISSRALALIGEAP